MCGIAGYCGQRVINGKSIEKCLDLMKRRGPDSDGVYQHSFSSDRNVLLLHTRLSIIDLDKRANQPYRHGTKTIAHNGEIYNYLEVRSRLTAEGRLFSTTSDTEVLIQCLDAYGYKGLDLCEGMWAFALYDEDMGTLVLSRDRFGEKPLYLYEDASGIYFGSEIKFLMSLAGRRFEVNTSHLYRFLVHGYKSLYKVRETFFQGVRELLPSHVMEISPDGVAEEKRYWYPAYSPKEAMPYEEAVEGARDALVRSVELRLRADVPLAFCMSGGVDSNSIISIAKRLFDHDVHGFTIVNTDERYSEQDMVEHSHRELGIRHTEVPVRTDNFLNQMESLVRYHDAPVYTISYYAHWLLMESIAEHGYRIAVSGTAADELFTGYYDHHNMYLYEVRNDPVLFTASLENWNRHIKPIVRNPLLQDPKAFIYNPAQREHIYLNSHLFASYLKPDFKEAFSEVHYCEELLRNRMLNELFHESVPVILHEDDLNAMSFSIENRSPFLDRSLFDFCYTIPTRHLIQDGYNKKILRDAMRGIVPEPILKNRRKVGFNAPISSFLDTRDPDVRSYILDGGPVFDHVKKDQIELLLEKDYLPNSESKFLFYFIGAKMFLEANSGSSNEILTGVGRLS